MKTLTIVGGGTAGWFAAGWFSKMHPEFKITLVESPNVPRIGVGESVTPHVTIFFQLMGIEEKEWMKHTGAIYKYANKFVNWNPGYNTSEYSSFNYPSDISTLYKDIDHPLTQDDFQMRDGSISTADAFMHLIATDKFDKFDKYFHSQFHYMEQNVMPFDKETYLLNPNYSWSQHINADMAADYIKDYHAIPNGVKHIIANVTDIDVEGDNVKTIHLDNATTISSDLYIDATGFKRIFAKKLGLNFIKYTKLSIDSAWVCQTEYEDPSLEMVNYTQSIAEPYGWRFKVGLYHRMGNGYCFSSKHINDSDALEYFEKQIGKQKTKPRLIKWTPGRIDKPFTGNVAMIGLSIGFVEALEATSLLIITESIRNLSDTIKGDQTVEWYNHKMIGLLDNISEFILTHYTLSNRDDSDFWKDMRELGRKEEHTSLVYEKYKTLKFGEGHAYPDFMWAQVAKGWNMNLSNWVRNDITDTDLQLAHLHFSSSYERHRLISQSRENNYVWLKNYIFDGVSPEQWLTNSSK